MESAAITTRELKAGRELFRMVLQQDCISIKVMNLMTMGPYESPVPAWTPSVTY